MAVSSERAQSRLLSLATMIAVVSVLYFAREVLIPLAMAILVSFILAPIVLRLQRLGFTRVPAVLTAVACASALVFVSAWIFLYQMVDLAEQLPAYQKNIVKKVEVLNSSLTPWIRKASKTIEDVNSQIDTEKGNPSPESKTENTPETKDKEQPAPPPPQPKSFTEKLGDLVSGSDTGKPERDEKTAAKELPARAANEPVPVQIVSTPTSFSEILNSYVGPVLGGFGTAAVIAILAIFILIEREDLRNRFIRLIGDRQLHTTTEALDDASTRVSKYLLMQLIVNVTYGLAVSIGLWLIGSFTSQPIPNVAVFGLMATVLRFIPYIGPWIAAVLPIVLSLAISDGWLQPLLVIGWFIVLELLSNNVMEPMLYGSSTGISAFGIIISAVFWTWLWGGVGLVLATPLTVCMMVLGRHVPQFRYLEILLGDQPPLAFSATVYQRLLALDEDEVANTAKKYLQDHQLGEFFDEVLLPALVLANQDHQQGRIDDARWHYIHDALRELVVDLQEEAEKLAAKKQALEAQETAAAPADAKEEGSDSKPLEAKRSPKGRVVCLAARDDSDELAGQMLAVLLLAEGYDVEVLAPREGTGKDSARESSTIESVAAQPQLLWISALPPLADARAREVCRQITHRHSRAAVSVGLWNETLHPRNLALLQRAGARDVATTLREAIGFTNQLLNPVPPEPPAAVADSVNTTPLSGTKPSSEKAPAIAG